MKWSPEDEDRKMDPGKPRNLLVCHTGRKKKAAALVGEGDCDMKAEIGRVPWHGYEPAS